MLQKPSVDPAGVFTMRKVGGPPMFLRGSFHSWPEGQKNEPDNATNPAEARQFSGRYLNDTVWSWQNHYQPKAVE